MLICAPKHPQLVVTEPSKFVTWEGWGTSLCWFAHALGGEPTSCAAVCKLLFSKDNGLGFNIVRYNLGGANQEKEQEYRPGAAVPCFAQPDGRFDWDVDVGQLAMLLAAVKLGADTVEAFVNSPPWFWTVSGSSRGHQHPLRSNLEKQHIQDFAKFCAAVVTHFQATHGITFRSLSPFNEPGSPAWCLAANCKQEGCFFSRRRAHKVLRALQEQPGLQQTELVAYEQFCVRDTLGDLRHTPKELRSAIARVNTHTYDSSTFFHGAAKPLVLLQDNPLARQRLRKLLHKWGNKSLWVSEFGTGRGPLKLAAHIVKDIATLLPSAWVYWQAVEGIDSYWGLLEMPIRHPGPPPSAATMRCSSTAGDVSQAAASASAAAAAEGTAAGCDRPVDAVPAADGSTAGLVDTGAAGPTAQQQSEEQAGQVVLHPNYFVLLFLIQAVPVGSRVCRVKGCGDHGFAVWRPHTAAGGRGGWSLVCINQDKSTACTLRVTASTFPTGCQQEGDGGASGRHAAEGSTPASADGAEAGGRAVAAVHLLDVAALQNIKLQCADVGCNFSPAQLLQARGYCTKTEDVDHAAGGCVVEVPPSHLCRIDWSL